jgi:hypothetical protein
VTADGIARIVHSPRRIAAFAAHYARLRALRDAGLIEKLPGRPKGLKRMKAEAEVAIAKIEAAEVEVSSMGGELAEVVTGSLKVMKEIVRRKRPYKGGDQHKLKVLQLDAAGKAINAQVRVDENVLRARQGAGALAPVLAALLNAAGESVPAAIEDKSAEDKKDC